MNSARLGAMVDYIDEQELPVDSVIVIRNGTIVLEESRSG
jgi:sulfur carrier protein ThiS